MASGWYGAGGALVTDEPIEGITHDLSKRLDGEEAIAFYGRRYFIGESMTELCAQRLCGALGLSYVEPIEGERELKA